MTSISTTRVALRLATDVYEAVKVAAADAGVETSDFMKDTLAQAVMSYLPQASQEHIKNSRKLYHAAQLTAKEIDAAGLFDAHFTSTVIAAMLKNPETRKLYEIVIGAGAFDKGAPGKTPVNMYLGWYVKNAVDAKPLLDSSGKVRRAFVEGQAIQSYTLLTK